MLALRPVIVVPVDGASTAFEFTPAFHDTRYSAIPAPTWVGAVHDKVT